MGIGVDATQLSVARTRTVDMKIKRCVESVGHYSIEELINGRFIVSHDLSNFERFHWGEFDSADEAKDAALRLLQRAPQAEPDCKEGS
jgi:hypothetical protein